MKTQTPYEWITDHFQQGVHLREKVYALTTTEEGEAWAVLAEQWYQEARDGIAARSPIDAGRLDVLDELSLLPLPWGNPWWEKPEDISMVMSSTGEGRPGNNPANWHARRVELLEEIAKDWRAKAPARKTGPKSRNLDKQVGTAERLLYTGEATSKLAAATLAVEKHGKGNCASEDAAIQKVRKNI